MAVTNDKDTTARPMKKRKSNSKIDGSEKKKKLKQTTTEGASESKEPEQTNKKLPNKERKKIHNKKAREEFKKKKDLEKEKSPESTETNQSTKDAKKPGIWSKVAESVLPADACEKIKQREEMRIAKNFAEADRIRDELRAMGVQLFDKHRTFKSANGETGNYVNIMNSVAKEKGKGSAQKLVQKSGTAYVTNTPKGTKKSAIKEVLKPFGNILSVKLEIDLDGTPFLVKFDAKSAVKKALRASREKDGIVVNDCKLKISTRLKGTKQENEAEKEEDKEEKDETSE
eukprot:m.146454 g.146454  ORF g.146454 m.146454 type:complete len:286 (+) comp14972_c0_seq1:205-1062(+)